MNYQYLPSTVYTYGTGGNTTAILPAAYFPLHVKGLSSPPGGDKNGVMLALFPSAAEAAGLATDGGTPAAELHITVAYLGKTADVSADQLTEAARAAAEETGPVTGQLSGLARFTGGSDGDVLVALYDSADLEDLRLKVRAALAQAGLDLPRDHGFTPHMTLGYLAPGDPAPVQRLAPKDLSFASLAVVYGTERTDIPLTGNDDGQETPDMQVPEQGAEVTETKTAADAEPAPADSPEPSETGGEDAPQEAGGEDTEAETAPAAPETPATETKDALSPGTFVALGGLRARIDMIVTSGEVPGARHPSTGEPVEGTAACAAARVTEYLPAGDGTYTAGGAKFAAPVSSLTRIAPLRSRAVKSLDEALGWALAEHAAGQLSVGTSALRTVYERGVKSYPGEHVTTLDAHQWALGRVDAFVAAAAGMRPVGYCGDDDLLPA